MTTIVSIKDDNFVVVGSDNGSTLGSITTKNMLPKIYKIKNMVVGYSGNLFVFQQFKFEPIAKNRDITDYMTNYFAPKYIKHIRSCLEIADPVVVQIIVCIDNRIFSIDTLGGMIEHERYTAVGSGSSYALGAICSMLNNKKNVRNIVERSLEIACYFDSCSVEPFTIYDTRGGTRCQLK